MGENKREWTCWHDGFGLADSFDCVVADIGGQLGVELNIDESAGFGPSGGDFVVCGDVFGVVFRVYAWAVRGQDVFTAS